MKIKLTKSLFNLRKDTLILIMRTFIFLFCTTVFSLTPTDLFSQNSKIVIDEDKKISVDELFDIIDRQTDYRFIYHEDLFKDSPKVELKKGKISLNKLLLKSLLLERLNIILTENNTILIKEKTRRDKSLQQQVSGTVTDANGILLPGVTVRVKGTSKGTATDFDGSYSVTVPNPENVLVFSFLGFKTQEIVVNNKAIINIQLKEDVTGLEETVVVAYGKIKRETLTGSVSVVDVESIANQGTIINVDQALQGQVAGVQVSSPTARPGAASRVRIRGSSSILGTNQPLYVIDGVPIEPSSEVPGFSGFIDGASNVNEALFQNEGVNNDLGFIDFNNIESITILKDASATAIYGSRAAAGVVVITTKKGTRSTKPQFEFLVTESTNFTQRVDVLNSSQYQQIYKEAIENYQNSGGTVPSNDSFAQGVLAGTEVDESVNIDWQRLVSKNSTSTRNYAFNVRGASEKGSYYSSLSLQKNEGAIDGDELTRYAFSLNLRQNLKDNLQFFSNISLGRIENNFALSSPYEAPFIRPDKEPYDENGVPLRLIGDVTNPIAELESRQDVEDFSLLASVGLEFEPIKNLFIKSTGLLQYIDRESYSFYPSFVRFSGISRGSLVNSKTINPSVETTVTYDFSLQNKHNFNVLVGNTYQNNNSKTTNAFGENFPNDYTLTSINYASENLSNQLAITKSNLISFFSRLQYDYDNKYLLSVTARTDGSSKFGANKRWASFPSVGIGWNIHREEFAKNISWLNFLKLRSSYGQSGNVTFDPNQSFSLFGALNGTLGTYDGNIGVVPLRIGNPDLKWEITTQKDFGLEFAVFNIRVKGEIGYYQKDTKDVLFQTELPLSVGIGSIIANIGDTQNRGFELSLDFDILNTKDLKWNLRLNAATAKSKVTRLNTTYKNEFGHVNLGGLYLIEGQSLGLIRGHVAEGIFQTPEEIEALNANAPSGFYQYSDTDVGDIKYADLDGDGEVDPSTLSGPDVTNIGNIEPDFFGGINSTLNYKGFALNVFANYSVGNDIYWKAAENTFSFTSLNDQNNKLIDILDRWTPDNIDSKYPRAVYRTNLGGGNRNNRRSSLYSEKGDYLRIKTITLTYSLPKEILKKINLQGLSLYVTGTNLFTFTKYSGADPEFANVASFRTPVDNNNYPTSKQFITGMRLTF